MSLSSPRVLIIGGGIGGFTTALALLRKGIDCEIYEQAPELREIGAGLQLAPNGVRALFSLGLEDRIRSDGVEASDKVIRLWSTGQTWSLFDPGIATAIERFGAPMFLMHRADLHAILVDAVRQIKADAIHLSTKCVTMEQTPSKTFAHFDDGRMVEGDVLIGADGLHSQIRAGLFGPATPKFTGIVAWRGMAAMDRLPAHLRIARSTQWLGPTGHVTCYPVQRGRLLNFVGEIERDDWQKESWVERGSREECLRDFEGWHTDLFTIMEAIEVFYKWALFLRDPLPQWSVGRVSLLGDACHAMLPFLGQGANMAIEDAVVLAQCLSEHKQDVASGLRRFETLRLDRTSDIVLRSARMADTFHNEALADPTAGAAYIGETWEPAKIRNRYDTIYRYDVTAIQV